MGTAKKYVRRARLMQTRTKTKGSKYTSLPDPATNNALLSTQLHALGLYAVETLGDGNCLFRALSDQLYGTPNYHFKVRTDICDWIKAHKERYEPFVEDDRGLDVHLRSMREQGTYGGHMELSAFAHRNHRDVKVIQPGLVYVIEWDGGDLPATGRDGRRRSSKSKDFEQEPDDDDDDDDSTGTVYIAYHDWEHFSSVRNISGPHQGIPRVVEAPQPPLSPGSIKASASGASIKLRIPRPKIILSSSSSDVDAASIALPRSPSPSSQDSSHLTSASASSLVTPDDSTASLHTPVIRHSRSPKRSLADSEADYPSDSTPYSDKKHKTNGLAIAHLDDDDALSDLSSLAPESQPSTPARVLSPPAEDTLTDATPRNTTRPLTRRQRKALGLPKPRGPTAGKIVIPGGKHPKRHGKGWVIVSEDEEEAAQRRLREQQEQTWMTNGAGRVDVRGFKELRI